MASNKNITILQGNFNPNTGKNVPPSSESIKRTKKSVTIENDTIKVNKVDTNVKSHSNSSFKQVLGIVDDIQKSLCGCDEPGKNAPKSKPILKPAVT